MKVLHAITTLGVGGAERVVHDLAESAADLGVEAEVVSFSSDGGILNVAGPLGAPVHVFDIVGKPLSAPSNIWRYVKLLKSFKPDVVHAHMFHALLFTQLALAFLSARPRLVFTSHNSVIRSRVRRVWLRLTRWTRHADVLFAAEQHPDLNAKVTKVVRNGVPVPTEPTFRRIRAPTESIKFITVGRLFEQKDPIGLLRAFAQADLPNATLAFAGDGPMRGAVTETIRELGLERRVQLLGVRSDIRELLRSADVFVMHSRWEGLPIALLEAGAEAMPVIATPVGSVPDVLSDGRGWLAPPGAFADALRWVAANPSEARDRGRKLYAWVSEYCSALATARSHLALYKHVVSKG